MQSIPDGNQAPIPLQFTPQQERVLDILKKRHHDPDRICRWFTGALHAYANTSNPDRLAQAGNSLRELLEKFLDAEGVPIIGGDLKGQLNNIRDAYDRCKKSEYYTGGWKGKVIRTALVKIFDKLEKYLTASKSPSRQDQTANAFSVTDPMHTFTSADWKEYIKEGIGLCAEEFQNFAHHKVPPAEGEERFAFTLDKLEKFLLFYFDPPLDEAMAAVRKVAKTEPSMVADCSKILKNINSSEPKTELFFKELDSPAWVAVLVDEGFFKSPPEIREVGDNRINYTVWWPLMYLLRVTAKLPELAVKICSEVPPTKNPRPYFEIIRIGLEIKDIGISIRLKDKLLEYADFPFHVLGGDFGSLLAHWAKGDERAHTAALELADHLIAFRIDPDHNPATEGYQTFEVKPAFREHQYSKILKEGVRSLAGVTTLRTVKLLVGAMRRMIDLRYTNMAAEADKPDDASASWCRQLDVLHDSHTEEDKELAHTLTYACERACLDEATARSVDELLRDEKWKLFRRIRYHLYAKFPVLFKAEIQDTLVRFQGYAEGEYDFEFAQLVRLAFEKFGANLLTTDQLTNIFDQILSSPDAVSASDDTPSDEGRNVARREHIQRWHLWPFEAVLFDSYRETFSRLMVGHEINVYDYMGWGGLHQMGEIVTQSPISEEDLSASSDDDLIHTLNTWVQTAATPYEIWIRRNREGLGRGFAKIIAENPARFAGWGEKWKTVERPIYLRKAIEEASKLIPVGKHDEILSWLMLAQRILSKPLPPASTPEDEYDSRSEWQWARSSVVRFLRTCLDTNTGIAIQWRPQVWKMLHQLCCDPDARLDDSNTISSSSDLISIAINSTRGPALEGLIAYTGWSRKHGEPLLELKAGDQVVQLLEERFSDGPQMTWPELALLASNVHYLHWVSPTWVEKNNGKLFRQDEVFLWLSTFKAFLHYGSIRSTIYPVMKRQYAFALDHMDELRLAGTSKEKLIAPMGYQLTLLFLWGSYPLIGAESQVEQFYGLTTVDEKSDVMTRLGQGIHHARELDDLTRDRAMEFFEWRLNAAEATPIDGKIEFESVNSWIQSATLPPAWRLNMLQRVLRLRPEAEDFTYLTKFLVERLGTDLALVVECFALTTELGKSQSYFYVEPTEGKAILRAGRDSDVREVKEWAKQALNNLLSVRRFEFLDLDGD